MSALADALAAAQSRAVAALAKQYVGGTIDGDGVREALASVGLTDDVDTGRVLAAWDILRAAGATAPSEQASTGKPKDEPATDAQLGDDVADNLVPLCFDCHALVTDRRPGALLTLEESLSGAERAYLEAHR